MRACKPLPYGQLTTALVREVSLHSMRACKPLPYGQLTTALVPTVPSPCSFDNPLQSPRLEKHFCVGGRQSGRPWLGPGLV